MLRLIWLWERLYPVDGLSEGPVLIAAWAAGLLQPGLEEVTAGGLG